MPGPGPGPGPACLQAMPTGELIAPTKLLHRPSVEHAAAWLRMQLELRLFGFDVVVHQATGKCLRSMPRVRTTVLQTGLRQLRVIDATLPYLQEIMWWSM